MKFLWMITFLMSIVAGLTILGTFASAGGAPQQAAGFALACAFAIVPYVFTKAAEGMTYKSTDQQIDRLIAAMTPKVPETPAQTIPDQM